MDLKHKILDTITRFDMIKKGEAVLVAVSGGPDSVFLLHLLNNIKQELGIKLYVVHVNHNTRGKESERDAQFIKNLSKTLRIKIACRKLNNPTKAKSKFSLEERLRAARYEFFENAARRLKVRTVATAHTLDDQAETVLMRIIKGASLKGIIGIHPVRDDKHVKFIRPVIDIEKRDIVEYLKKKRLPFRIDRTNEEEKFLRNKIRKKIMPYLAKINPRIRRSLFNLAESLREDFEFIEEEKAKRLRLIKTKPPAQYILLKDVLLQPKALQRELVREALKKSGANIKKLNYRHWKDIDKLLRTSGRGKSLDLPGGVRAIKEAKKIIFSKTKNIAKRTFI